MRKADGGAVKDVVITQFDVENMLRAKAAIYSAALVLLNSLKLGFEDLDKIYVAGAFGNYLNVDNAILIGLLPDMPTERIQFVGNTSVAGAKLVALSRQKYREVREIARKMTYFELSTERTSWRSSCGRAFSPHGHREVPTRAAETGRDQVSMTPSDGW